MAAIRGSRSRPASGGQRRRLSADDSDQRRPYMELLGRIGDGERDALLLRDVLFALGSELTLASRVPHLSLSDVDAALVRGAPLQELFGAEATDADGGGGGSLCSHFLEVYAAFLRRLLRTSRGEVRHAALRLLEGAGRALRACRPRRASAEDRRSSLAARGGDRTAEDPSAAPEEAADDPAPDARKRPRPRESAPRRHEDESSVGKDERHEEEEEEDEEDEQEAEEEEQEEEREDEKEEEQEDDEQEEGEQGGREEEEEEEGEEQAEQEERNEPDEDDQAAAGSATTPSQNDEVALGQEKRRKRKNRDNRHVTAFYKDCGLRLRQALWDEARIKANPLMTTSLYSLPGVTDSPHFDRVQRLMHCGMREPDGSRCQASVEFKRGVAKPFSRRSPLAALTALPLACCRSHARHAKRLGYERCVAHPGATPATALRGVCVRCCLDSTALEAIGAAPLAIFEPRRALASVHYAAGLCARCLAEDPSLERTARYVYSGTAEGARKKPRFLRTSPKARVDETAVA